MSERTICFSCGGRTYEHAKDCRLIRLIGLALDDLALEDRATFVAPRVYAARLIERLQLTGIVLHENEGECYVGDRLIGKASA